MKKIREQYTHILQKLGIGLSLLCAIHCLATPLLLLILPAFGGHFFSEGAERALLLGSLLIGSFILTKDYRLHHQKLPLSLLLTSALAALAGLVIKSHVTEMISSVLMAAAFLINWRMHNKVCSVS
jgi:hypothetical protein